jgi:hypothetical protein
MANENKNAPGSQGSGNQQGGQTNEPNDDRKDAGRPGGQPSEIQPGYGEQRPGYDIDIETEIPGREIPGAKEASHNPEQPGAGKSGMGYGGRGGRPEVADPSRSRNPREAPSADDERQAR